MRFTLLLILSAYVWEYASGPIQVYTKFMNYYLCHAPSPFFFLARYRTQAESAMYHRDPFELQMSRHKSKMLQYVEKWHKWMECYNISSNINEMSTT